MTAQNNSPLSLFLGVTLLLALVAFPARAHHGADQVFATPQPPAESVLQVAATGTVDELIVNNRVLNLAARYVALRLDDGQVVALDGPGLDALPKGARVEAIGRKAGNTLFVTETHVVAGAQGRDAAAAGATGTTSVQGTLRVFHADNFAEGRGEFGLVIQGDDGHATQLNVAVVPDTLRAGMSVIAYGSVAANGFALDVTSITVLAMPPADVNPIAAAPITNKVLVIAIKFSDSAAEQFTATNINTQMQTVVAPYYQEVSYGQQLLNITIACFTTPAPAGCTPARVNTNGWLLSPSVTPANCDWSTMGSLASAAATAAGYNTSSYNNIYYVLPPGLPCGWAGLAYVGFGLAWSNNVNALWVYGHELGHNFGLWHSGYLYCSGQSIGLSCSASEYNDPFDIMGNRYTGHFNSMQKSHLGWIPPSSVKTHTSGSATYTLSPLESPGQSTYAVKIPAAANRTYWIEYRQPIGLDSGIPSSNGAQFRVASPLAFPCSQGCDTEVLDMSLATGDTDAALLLGQTYTDSQYGINVTVTGVTTGQTGSLTLAVSMGGKSPSTTTLASSANPSLVGANVTFTATVAGAAPTGTVAFASDTVTLAGCGAVAFSGGTVNARTATCSTSTLTQGTHSIIATYGGDANNLGSASTALSQVVNAVPTGLVNGSFEIPALGAGYQYNPNSVPGVGWTFTHAGVQGNGSAWGAAPAPNGTQTAFLQNISSIAQTLTLNAGSYTLSFQVAQRLCCTSPFVQPVKVSVDGIQIGGLISPASMSFAPVSVTFSVATTGAHTLSFAGTAAGDKTTFIDNVTLVPGSPPAAFVNSSFEIPALGSSYQYDPSVAGIGWTFSGGSGIQGNGSAWGAASAPAGTQTAFVQSTGSISQALTLNAGSYTLSFRAAQRSCCVSPFVQPVRVSVDGIQIGSLVSPASASFAPVSIPFSVGTTGAHTFTFTGTDGTDKTTFIDSVTVQ